MGRRSGAGALISETGMDYTMEVSDSRTQRGTTITLIYRRTAKNFEGYRLREILNKYCSFLPVEIYFRDVKEKKKDDGEDPKPINDIRPLLKASQ